MQGLGRFNAQGTERLNASNQTRRRACLRVRCQSTSTAIRDVRLHGDRLRGDPIHGAVAAEGEEAVAEGEAAEEG